MRVSQYNCPVYFTILASALLKQIASFSPSDCYWSCKSCKCQWTACTWNFHFFVMYSHLLEQINCTAGIGWLSTTKTQLYCFHNCLWPSISVMLFIWRPVWTNNLSRTLFGFMKDRQPWNPFPEPGVRNKTLCNQWPPDWRTTGAVWFINLWFVWDLKDLVVKRGMAASLTAGGSKNCHWQYLVAQGVEHDQCRAAPGKWCCI